MLTQEVRRHRGRDDGQGSLEPGKDFLTRHTSCRVLWRALGLVKVVADGRANDVA